MAIAGSTANVFSLIRLSDGSLVVNGPHRIAGHLVESDEQQIVNRLATGDMVYIAAYGTSKPELLKRYGAGK